MPNVTVIPATRPIHSKAPTGSDLKRQVAGYARVSTDSDEQFTSYEAQVDYYTHYIQSHTDWDFVGVYADEGISGLNTKNRDGFNPEHRGQPHYHPQTQGRWLRVLL